MFYAEIPDIVSAPSEYQQTVIEPDAQAVPANAPIQIQYEALDLVSVMDWIRQYYPQSTIDLSMLQAFDRGAQSYNVSLGLLLGILNAEHGMLQNSNVDGQWNPFSYGWTSETNTNIDWAATKESNQQRSAAGAASIVATVANSLMRQIGAPNANDGSPWLQNFITLLGNYYVTGRPIYSQALDFGPYHVPTWITNATSTTTSLYRFVTDPSRAQSWVSSVKHFASIGGKIFGTEAAGIQSKVFSVALPAMYMGYQKFMDGWTHVQTFASKISGKALCVVGIVIVIALFATGIGEIGTAIAAGIEAITTMFTAVMEPIITAFAAAA